MMRPGCAALVIVETHEGAATPLTLELVALARSLADDLGGTVDAALMLDREGAAQALFAHGADRVYVRDCAEGIDDDAEAALAAIEHVCREARPQVVLAPHTPFGADLAPRLAFRLGGGVATGCSGTGVDRGRVKFTRPCFGGNVRETVSFTSAPAIATIRPGVARAGAHDGRTGETVRFEAPATRRRARVIARDRDTASAKRLEDAKIIVAGGRGLEGPEGFRVLEDLAQVLGGEVGSSRVPCDLGWCPHSWQIGLTGKTVTPELYVAVGISGAGHHMAGCGNAGTIVAINTDADAAIFGEARYGVVGDYRKIVPALTRAVAQLKHD